MSPQNRRRKRSSWGQSLAQAQLIKESAAMGQVLRRWQRRGCYRHVMAGEHLAGLVIVAIGAGLRIRLQGIQQRIVGPLCELGKRLCRHCAPALK